MSGLRLYIPAWGGVDRSICSSCMEEIAGILYGLAADAELTACPVEVGGTVRGTLLNRPLPRLAENEYRSIVAILNCAAMREKAAIMDAFDTDERG